MADLAVHIQLVASHEPTDSLQLRVGSGPGLKLSESDPVGGIIVTEEPIGSIADVDPAPLRTLLGSHRPPDGCAVLALGVSVMDAAGNVSTLYETFAEIADHPRGVDTKPVQATGSDNEALFTWAESSDLEGALT